jgi:hypothetical protein
MVAERRGRDTEKGDATLDLLLKYSDATLAIYVRRQMKHLKYASEIFTKNT